jgi:hypothetical protein
MPIKKDAKDKKKKPKTDTVKVDGATAFAVAGSILLMFAIAGLITSRRR